MSTCVFYFGGYNATENDVKAWLASARAQEPGVQFTAYPWPRGAGPGASSAVGTFMSTGRFESAIGAVESSGAETIYIVGHSSGCAIANSVDRKLKDHSRVVLVSLDGFVPDSKQRARMNTQVWAAECQGRKSRNYAGSKGVVGGRLKVYSATNCKTSWALHFSLVNAGANDAAVKSIATGYARCRANLIWM